MRSKKLEGSGYEIERRIVQKAHAQCLAVAFSDAFSVQCLAVAFSDAFSVDWRKRRENGSVDVLRFQ